MYMKPILDQSGQYLIQKELPVMMLFRPISGPKKHQKHIPDAPETDTKQPDPWNETRKKTDPSGDAFTYDQDDEEE